MTWGFLFSVSKSTGGNKREWCQSYEEVVGFDSLQELSVGEENCLLLVVPFRRAFLGIYLDFSCILMLLCLSRRIHKTPAASWTTGSLPHTSGYHEWTLQGRMEKKRECFFFIFQLEIFVVTPSHPRHTDLPQDPAERLDGHCHTRWGEPLSKAGTSGSWVCVTWAISWTLLLSHGSPTETDSLLCMDVTAVLQSFTPIACVMWKLRT